MDYSSDNYDLCVKRYVHVRPGLDRVYKVFPRSIFARNIIKPKRTGRYISFFDQFGERFLYHCVVFICRMPRSGAPPPLVGCLVIVLFSFPPLPLYRFFFGSSTQCTQEKLILPSWHWSQTNNQTTGAFLGMIRFSFMPPFWTAPKVTQNVYFVCLFSILNLYLRTVYIYNYAY